MFKPLSGWKILHLVFTVSSKLLIPFFLIVITLPSLLFSQEKLKEISLYPKETIVTLDSLLFTYTLPDSFLIEGSEKVRLDSLLLKAGQDYSVDAIHGSITFKNKPSHGGRLRISYRVLPLTLKSSYKRRSPKILTPHTFSSSDDSSSAKNTHLPKPVRREVLPGAKLRKSGSIIRGVAVGSNQSLQVDSGLRMQVSGQLTPNVEIIASLTDQDTPIQPEGNTQTLNEIDKVFVQIKGPNLQATLGDINLTLGQSEFMNYNRKLEGIITQGDFEKFSFKASAAVSRGQFVTNEFTGQEGNQGPYQLSGENGNIDILIIAGTEKVWIDGEPMKRGENNDYIIEYGNGQISFTRNRLITADSRIVIDFQFSDESFQKNYFALQGRTKLWNDRIQFGTTFIRESDDKNDPLGLVLNTDVLDALDNVGDSLALVPGDTLVGEGKGAYIKDATGTFVYLGPGEGNYNVRFSFFGAGQGDYRNIGFGRFEFAGENNGDYQPFIILPRAQKHDVVGFNLNFNPTRSVTLRSEMVFSQFDQNLYSSLNDDDNNGNAYSVRLNFSPEKIRFRDLQLGTLSFTGNVRKKSENYRDIDRSTIAEFNRRWNLSNTNSNSEENILEVGGTYIPVTGLSIRTGLGKLSKSSLFQSNRLELQTSLTRGKLPQLDYFVEVIDRNDKRVDEQSNWLRQRGRSEVRWKSVRPFAEYEGEIRKDTDPDSGKVGFKFDSYTGGLFLSPGKKMSLSARYNVRDDKDRVNGNFVDKSIAKTQVYNWSFQNLKGISLAASYTHRNRSFSDPVIQDSRTDLADLRLAYKTGSGWLNSNFYYQISNAQVASQEQVYIEVGEGEGNFSFNSDLNEFEPDQFGNFVLRLFASNNFEPVVDLRLQGDIRLKPANFFKGGKTTESGFLQKWLTPISTETFIRIEEKSQEEDVKKIYLLNFDSFQDDSTTIFGRFEIRQDVHLWENKKDFSLRYRLRRRDELNNRFVDGRQDRLLLENNFRLRYQFSNQLNTQIELSNVKENRLFGSLAREDRKIRSNELEMDFLYRPVRKWEIGLKSGFRLSRDIIQEPVTKATIYDFTPRVNYAISNKGRLRMEFTWTKVDLSPKNKLIPFELTDGNAGGLTYRWNLGFDYRVSRNIQASMTYLGRREPDRPEMQHIARAEMRAFF